MPGAVSFALLLAVATVQLQSAGAASFRTEHPAKVRTVTASSLIQKVEEFFKVCGISEMEKMYYYINCMCPELKSA